VLLFPNRYSVRRTIIALQPIGAMQPRGEKPRDITAQLGSERVGLRIRLHVI